MNFSAKKMFFIDLLITIIGVLFDQFTKHLAVLRLKDQAPVSLIPGALELRYLENRVPHSAFYKIRKSFLY